MTDLKERKADVKTSTAIASEPRPKKEQNVGGAIGGAFSRFALIIVLVVLVVAFSVLRPETFPTINNTITIVASQDVLIVLAVGLLFPLLAGEFDLSIGFILGFTAMEVAVLTGPVHMNVPLAFVVTLLTGAAIGGINALLVLRLRVNAFIATLGTGTILAGLTLLLSNGAQVANLPDSVNNIGTAQVFLIPDLAVFALVVAVIIHFVLGRTPFGRYLLATGAGREAAKLAGVRTGVLLAVAFVVAGFMAAVAGIMQTTITGSADPSVGSQYLLPAFAAAFLGATVYRSGRFNVPGTILALFVIAVGVAGLSQLGAPLWVSSVFDGVALILAVALSVRRKTRLESGN